MSIFWYTSQDTCLNFDAVCGQGIVDGNGIGFCFFFAKKNKKPIPFPSTIPEPNRHKKIPNTVVTKFEMIHVYMEALVKTSINAMML